MTFMQLRFRSLSLAFGVIMFIAIPSAWLLGQDVPDDPSTPMTIESGDSIDDSAEDPNNQDVAADPSYSQPQEPYSPDLPETTANYEGPVGVTGIFNGNVTTGCSYDPLSHSAHRQIDDIVVPGSVGKYPLKMTRYYNSRQQYYATPGSIGLSPGWAYEYSWLLWSAGHKVVSPHGNVYDDYCGAPVGVSEGWEQRTDAYNGTWRLADGGKVIFVNGRVTYIDDPYGLRTTIFYDGNGRRWKVQEPGGRYLQFIYGPAADPDGTVLLTRVEAHGLGNATVTDWVNYTYTLVSAGVIGRNKKMLTGVTYSDGTSATYEYRTDNVTESTTTHKMYPLLQRCNDVRYNGPMRTIRYEYQNAYPHGSIANEKYPGVGAVSAVSPTGPDTFTETRGDGPTRSFTYTHLVHCVGDDCDGPCAAYGESEPHNQMLDHYTDFKGRTTYLGYDPNTWYITSVRDANDHTTYYERNAGLGAITKITHPDFTHIDYTYYNEGTGCIGGHYLQQVTNERGAITYYTRDVYYRVTRIDYKDESSNILAFETFTYNSFGQVLTHRLKNGAYESFAYDTRGLLTDEWNPKQNAVPSESDPHTHYTYHTWWGWADRVYSETLPANASNQVASDRYEYDRNASGGACPGRGLVTKITHADGKYRSFGYSQFGNKIWEENELRQRTSYTYDNYNRVLTATRIMSPAPNETTIYTYNPTNGTGTSPYLHTTNNPDSVTTPTGIITKNDYDQNFRKTSSTAAYGTTSVATTWFHYDPVGNQDYVTNPRGSGPGDAAYTTYTDYDSRNRKWRVREPLSRTTEFHYDDGLNLTRVIRPDQTTETKTYDAMNRVLTDTVPQTSTINLTTWFVYNPSGTIYKIIDPNGQPTWFAYNASDEKVAMLYSGQTQSQSWVYDDVHNLASRTTVNGETQSFTYDNRNRKVTMRWSNNADWANFAYDDVGRLWVAANANSTVSRAYDAAGRLYWERQNIADFGIRDVRYEHNAEGNQTRLSVLNTNYDYRFTYDGMGRFEKIFAPGLTNPVWQYTYDRASNETARLNLYDGVAQTYTPRDALNRMTRRDIKKGATTISYEAYTYDAMNRLRSVTREDGKTDSFTPYLDGQLNTAQYGATPAPTATPTPTPSPTPTPTPGQVATPTFAPNGGDVSGCAYNYTYYVTIQSATSGALIRYTTDGTTPTPTHGTQIANGDRAVFTVAGHTTLKAMAYKSGMTNSSVRSADYYFHRDCGQGPTAPDTIRTVGYYLDKAGNRTSVTDTLYGNTSYTPNSLNQYTAVTGNTITNGPEHEISAYQNVSYTYINDEHLTSVADGTNSYDLKYDALGRCVKRTLNNNVLTYYIYDGEKPILEYDSAATQVGWNVYGKGIDEILQRIAYGTGNYFFQQDHEGSVTHLTDTSGVVIEKYRYDAFGLPTIYSPGGTVRSTTIYDNRFLFTGREYAATYRSTYVSAFKFYEYRARAYNPTLGRFMSEDPKLFDAGDYNLFRYCHNDPIDMTDPMGLETNMAGFSPLDNHNASAADAVWAMAKWADSSNNFQGTFAQFASGQSLTMGQVGQGERGSGMRVERAIPIRGQRDPLLDRRTENNLAALAEPVEKMARSLLYHARTDLGLDVRIIQGTRTYAEQNALYAQGRTTPGPIVTNAPGGYSFHNFGVAFDVGLFRGRAYIEGGSGYINVGHLGERIGLEWGGRWRSFQDLPHFQYPGLSLDVVRAHFEQGLSPIPGY
jgi:RHS repeat-associated protein